MKAYKKYDKMKDAGNNDSLSDGIKTMLEDMRIYVSNIFLNQHFIRMYYPIGDAIRNKGGLTLISPPYIKEFSKLLQFTRDKVTEKKNVSGVMLPLESDVFSILTKENNVQ